MVEWAFGLYMYAKPFWAVGGGGVACCCGPRFELTRRTWFLEEGRETPCDCGVPCRVRGRPLETGGDAEGAWLMCWNPDWC